MSSTTPEVKQASLSTYILLAEASTLPSSSPRTRPIFNTAFGISTPILKTDRENRIILYPGCFNPLHLGHKALLWHTYLSTDSHTIAAMILPVDDVSEKTYTDFAR
jgi:hypothetical protein